MTAAVFLVHHTRPGQRDAVRAVWERHMQPAIAANPGHVAYAYCFDADDGDVIRVFQAYVDGDAAVAFLRTDAYAAYLAEVEPLLEGDPELHRGTVEWSR